MVCFQRFSNLETGGTENTIDSLSVVASWPLGLKVYSSTTIPPPEYDFGTNQLSFPIGQQTCFGQRFSLALGYSYSITPSPPVNLKLNATSGEICWNVPRSYAVGFVGQFLITKRAGPLEAVAAIHVRVRSGTLLFC